MSSNNVISELYKYITDTIEGFKLLPAIKEKITAAAEAAYDNVEELDTLRANIQMATGASDSKMDDLMNTYQNIATEISSTTKATAESAEAFIRMGLSISDANKMIGSSEILAKNGMMESEAAAESLIAGMEGYQIAAEDSMKVVDRLTAVGSESGLSVGELAKALANVSEAASEGGSSMDRLIGYIAAVGEDGTASISEVGSGLQSIYGRMNSLRSGSRVDKETGESLADTESELNKVGILLRDSENIYRDFDDVLDEIGNRWRSLTQEEQNAVSIAVAGSKQRETFTLLMENYSTALQYSETASNSAGAALEKYGGYQDSIEAKTNALTAAFEALSMNAIDTELYGRLLKATTGMVEFVDKSQLLKGTLAGLAAFKMGTFVSGIMAGANSLSKMTTAFTLLKTDTSNETLKKVGLSCRGLSDQQVKLILSTKGLDAEKRKLILTAKGLTAEEAAATLHAMKLDDAQEEVVKSTYSLKGVWSGLWTTMTANPLMSFSTIVGGVSMIYNAVKQHQEELRQSTQEAANALEEQKNSIGNSVDQYKALHNELLNEDTSLTRQREIKKELLALQKELNEKYGEEYGKINLVSNAYKDQSEAIEKYTAAVSDNYLNENVKGIKQSTKKMEKEKYYGLSYADVSPYTKEGQALQEIAEKYKKNGMVINTDMSSGMVTIGLNANARNAYKTIDNFMDDVRAKAKELGDEHIFDDVLTASSRGLNKAKKTIEDYGDQYDQARISKITKDDTLSQTYGSAIKAVEEYNDAVIGGDQKTIKEARENLKGMRDSINLDEGPWAQYADIITEIFDQADTRVYDFTEALQNNQNGIAGWAETLKGLSQTELESMVNDGFNGDVFDRFQKQAEGYNLSAEELIDTLTELGYIEKETRDYTVQPLSYTDTIDELKKYSSSLKSISSTYQSFADNGYEAKFDDLTAIRTEFEKVDGIDNYIRMMEEANGSTEAMNEAFTQLSEAYLQQTGILDKINDDNAELIADFLEEQGIVNASAIVYGILGQQKAEAAWNTENLSQATSEEIMGLAQEMGLTGEAADAFGRYIAAKILSEAPIDVSGDITALTNMINALGITSAAWAKFAYIKQHMKDIDADPNYQAYDENHNKISKGQVLKEYEALAEIYRQEAMQEISSISIPQYGKGPGSNPSGGTSTSRQSGKTGGKAFSEEINYIDRALEVSKRRLQNYKNVLEDALTIEEKDSAIDNIVKETQFQLEQMTSVYQYYSDEAAKILAQIPEDIRDKVKNGAEEIENLNDENVSKLIKQFYDLDASANDADGKVRDLKNSIHDMKMQKIQIQIEGLERTKSKLERLQDQYETAISAVTSSVQSEIDEVNSYYDSQIANVQKQIDALDEQNDKLEVQRNLEEALYNLRRAENQRTNRIYREGQGFVYEADQDAVREAQESYDSAELDKTKYDLEQIIDRLEEERSQEVDYLTSIKDTWEGIADSFERMADMRMAEELFGTDNWLEDILNGDTDLFDEMQENFGNVFEGIFNTDQVIESLNDLKDWVENGEMSDDTALAVMNQQLSELGENAAIQSENMGEGFTSIYTSAENAKTLSADTYAAWTENLRLFQEETLPICEGLITQFNNMADAVVLAAERARQAAADMESLGGGDGGEGVTTTKEPIRSPSSSGGPGVKHHKGILNGTNGNPNTEDKRVRGLRILSTEPLKSNEVPIIALDDEVSLTREQQEMTLRNFQTAMAPRINLSGQAYSMIQPIKQEPSSVEYNFSGGIHITEAQNVTDIARGVKAGMLKQALDQELYKR